MADPTNYTPDPMPDSYEMSSGSGGSGGSGTDGTLFGSGDPEGAVTGSRGDTYLDTSVSPPIFYAKATGDSTTTGWVALII